MLVILSKYVCKYFGELALTLSKLPSDLLLVFLENLLMEDTAFQNVTPLEFFFVVVKSLDCMTWKYTLMLSRLPNTLRLNGWCKGLRGPLAASYTIYVGFVVFESTSWMFMKSAATHDIFLVWEMYIKIFRCWIVITLETKTDQYSIKA